MNWIDNMISQISPRWGYQREAWRQGLAEMQRNYDAGGYGRINANWRVHNESAEITDKYDRDIVRARARDLERNSDIMNSTLSAFERNIIGKGYTLQPNTGENALDDEIRALWSEWCKAKNCDVTGQQSFNEMMRMAVIRKKIDGGILFLKRYTDAGILPFQLQALEVDELDTAQIKPRNAGNKVVGGIEYNAYNRPVGYYIRQYSLEGYQSMTPVYIEAKDVIFYYTKRRPSQVREMSDMAQTMPRIRDTNEFMTAVSLKERIGACLAVFIKKVLPTSGIGRTGNSDGNKVSYEGKSIAPGMIKEMNAGDEIQVVNPNGTATDATQYTKLQQRMIGAGQGLSYEATSRDMSETNYSSARQGAIEDELTYYKDIEAMQEKVFDEIYETFLISAYLKGMLNMKGFWDSHEKKRNYMKHTWVATPKKWIDPAKEANANKIALQSGQKTFQQICAENGTDFKEYIDAMSEVIEYGESKGLELGGVIYGQKKQELFKAKEKKQTADKAGQQEQQQSE